MKIGQTVQLLDPKKAKKGKAVIEAIVGAGKSNWKVLRLRTDDEVLQRVYHHKDASAGSLFWLEEDEHVPRNWKATKKIEPVTTPEPPATK